MDFANAEVGRTDRKLFVDALAKVLMPCLQQFSPMVADEVFILGQLSAVETIIPSQANVIEAKLGLVTRCPYINVGSARFLRC